MRRQTAHTLVVHPDDVTLAEIKALAADRDMNVVANRRVQRGSAYLVHPSIFDLGPDPAQFLVGGNQQ